MSELYRKSPSSLFVLLTLLFSAVPFGIIAYTGSLLGGHGAYVTAAMWCPAMAALATTHLASLDPASLGFGWRNTKIACVAYLVPIGYAAIAYAFVWMSGLGGFAEPVALQPIITKLGWHFTNPTLVVPLYFIIVGTTGMVGATAACLGEELGWRGFLMPRLFERFGYTRGTLLISAIWATWHVPLILFSDYNGGTPPAYGLACFVTLIIAVSFIMTWLRLMSGSVWPAAIAHASHNLFLQGFFTPLTTNRGPVTAYAIDEFGFAVPTTVALVAFFLWCNRGKAIANYENGRCQPTSWPISPLHA